MTCKTFVVCEEGSGRLDRFLKKNVPVPYRVLMRAVRVGDVKVNGRRARGDVLVHKGDTVLLYGVSCDSIPYSPRALSEKDAQFLSSLCIYEDSDLWVCNKPQGLAVQGGTQVKRSLDDLLLRFSAPTGAIWRLVHRIDRLTSGLVICAKNRAVAQDITKLFREGSVTKEYWALVCGRVVGAGTLHSPIDGKDARTYYASVAHTSTHSLLCVRPETGRKRQIRQHLGEMNHPVVGDPLYGQSESFLGLQAFRVSFEWQGKRFLWILPLLSHIAAFAHGKGLDVSALS